MIDVAPEILDEIQTIFLSKYNRSDVISHLLKQTKQNYGLANEYAIEVGKLLAQTYQEVLSKELLPDGKMYWNIADRVIKPTLENNYKLIIEYASDTQEFLNRNVGIGIKPITPPLNVDRIKGILERVSSEEDFDKIKWILDEPIVNFSQSVIDDSIKINADFHAKAGMNPKIIRVLQGHGCKWCRDVAGEYSYPNVPKDVYRRHERCRCTVDYKTTRGSVQNVHSKKWMNSEEYDKMLLDRRKLGLEKKRTLIPQFSASKEITEKIQTGELSSKYNLQHFEKHSKGTRQYDDYLQARIAKGFGPQGVLTISYDQAQALIDEFSGTGIVLGMKSGFPQSKEDIDFKTIIGSYVYGGKETPTTFGRIHYGKNGAHIVPMKGERE